MASKKDSETIHYILTFIVVAVLIGSFATHIFTGKPALIPLDSFAGSLLLGIVFLCYVCWFAYEDSINNKISIAQAFKKNMKKNTTLKFIAIYWIVLIIIPAITNLLF